MEKEPPNFRLVYIDCCMFCFYLQGNYCDKFKKHLDSKLSLCDLFKKREKNTENTKAERLIEYIEGFFKKKSLSKESNRTINGTTYEQLDENLFKTLKNWTKVEHNEKNNYDKFDAHHHDSHNSHCWHDHSSHCHGDHSCNDHGDCGCDD
jgi:hypothetical protein